MFSIFQRRVRVHRYLPGGVDAHCHLLPGVDDGAPNMETALGIIRVLQSLGLRGAVCTPHIMSRYPDNTPANLRARFAELLATVQQDASTSGNPQAFDLYLAAEYMLDDAFLSLLEQPENLLAIPAKLVRQGSDSCGNSEGAADYVLLELPQYLQPEGWQDALDAVRRAGYTPLLAHPERYLRILSEADLRQLHARGLRYQGNLGSLAGIYGPQVQKLARRLHRAGLYTTFGTDAHSPSMVEKMELSA